MWRLFYPLSSPKTCYRFCTILQPWVLGLFLVVFVLGLSDALFYAPADYKQGEVYRVLFIHVPAACLSLGIYVFISVASFVSLVWKIKISDMVAKVSAPVGAFFTLLTLITGALWGKPTWGTFWIWDARLTSELILLFIYLGIIMIRSVIMNPTLASRASSIITLSGLINIPIIHYSVVWWHTLHQGATLLKWAKPSIASSMLLPLMLMLIAYVLFFVTILLIQLRSELLIHEKNASWVKRKYEISLI